MRERGETLKELRAVIQEQLILVDLALYVISEGPVLRDGQWLACCLEPDQGRATGAVAMGAGQSLNTILRNSTERGLAVRDLYPIARSVVEGFINAAFFTTQPVEVSQRAFKHVQYAAWKHKNRVIGTGAFMMTLGDGPSPKPIAARLFPEFTGSGQDSWCSLNTPSKINCIGKVVRASGGAFLGAYAGIYSVSSEIIHGSVYGMSYFMSAHRGQELTHEAFQLATEEQMVDLLSAVGHAASGFIAAFANIHQFGPVILEEHDLFKRLFKCATGDEWVGGDPPGA
ncbi:hypothetical protein AU074_21960 [Pseudomonas sp. ATCC PTA-122608]|uniref:hypothetical protein n=1 Tax=Pseudomonas sp. ATCC PTA-122608 TaxID=1771311 RepID=UPI00096B726B|nr:hypothetical protein [Pseudomonas sp. ATCC PTA-122608]OLY75734.1 hypothetical protein AU074_21960 [Pseudomonas sp. ATCC PTA-122608]